VKGNQKRDYRNGNKTRRKEEKKGTTPKQVRGQLEMESKTKKSQNTAGSAGNKISGHEKTSGGNSYLQPAGGLRKDAYAKTTGECSLQEIDRQK